jgi:putative glutamine amidotransferase
VKGTVVSASAPISRFEVIPAGVTVGTDAPLVCVVAPLNFPDLTEEIRELVVRYTSTALTTLAEFGARIVLVDPTDDEVVETQEDIDGLLLLGGGDADPALYGHVDDVPNLYGVDRRCDERTLDWIRHAWSRSVPMLGICRGAQMINLAYGGNLIPDLGPDTRHRGDGDGPVCVEDEIDIEPGTRLAEIIGRSTATVRSGHHQAVGDVAPQFRVAARGLDGVIEAIEHRNPDTWVFGVQWHPEDSDSSDVDRRALFSSFVTQVRGRAITRGARPGDGVNTREVTVRARWRGGC